MTVAPRPSTEDATPFVPLDPWTQRPDRRLLTLAPADFWRRYDALPLRLDEQGLLVAAASQLDHQALRGLRTATRQRVRLVSGARDEITFWLNVLEGRRSWAEALSDGLAELFEQLGLAPAADRAALLDTAQEALAVEHVVAGFGLAEDTAVEVLALRARLPWVRLERYRPASYLTGLLPRPDAWIMRVVPLVARGGLVVLASPQVLGQPVLDRLRELIGLPPRLVVCAPSAFEAAFVSVFGDAEASRDPLAERPSDAVVLRALAELGALDRGRLEAVRGLADATSESAVEAAIRLGYVDRDQVRRAWGRATGLPPLASDPPRAATDLAARGAPALWRRLRCVPLRRVGRGAVLAGETPLAPPALELVRHLLGASEVSLEQALPDEIDRLLERLPAAVPLPYTAEDHLLESGQVSPSQAARARRLAEREGMGLSEALVGLRLISAEDLVEARSVALGRPWVRLAHFAPEPDVPGLVPEELARAERAVPLRKHGQSLTLALLNGRDHPTPGVIERATGLAVDPVLAVVGNDDDTFRRWYAPMRAAVPPEYEAFGRALVRGGLIARGELDRAWAQLVRGGRLDEVLVGRGRLTPEGLRDALAAHLRVHTTDLELRQRRVQVVDAIGALQTEQAWEDPIDARLARQLPAALAAEHNLVAVTRLAGRVQVAFSNPLDASAVEAVSEALGQPVEILVGTRRAVEVARRRVYTSRSVGERLVRTGIVSPDQLARALQVHEQAGVRLGQALVNLGFVSERELAATLAEQADVPFVDLVGTDPDDELARRLPADIERHRGVLPLYDDGEAVVVGCTDLPEVSAIDDLTTQLGRPIRPVVVTESALDDTLSRLYRDEDLEHSSTLLVRRAPDDSARWVLSRGQKVFFWSVLAVLGGGLVLAPTATLTTLVGLATAFYLAFSTYKFYLAYRAVRHTLEVETTHDEIASLDDRDLPVYTILVPVYREAEVFPILARAIERLDYPKAKLDVKILLEEDDRDTIGVARASRLPSHFKLVVVPAGLPRGKPKACNYGLIHAQGEYVVIYDAEDIPEPDQLKKALVAFRKGGPNLACVQAKLNYFNRDQNLLTRWFTTEYSMWFDLFLPGLDASGAPIPLGGTSNHFRTDTLRELGAWDPHNVTEDADLGMRLYKAGSKTGVIDSTTYEEANSELYNWIRQRSRWVKGYIQTYLVHMRHPLRLWRAIGPRAFFSFQLVVGGTFFGFLVNPVFWLLTAVWFTTRAAIIKDLFPPPIFYLGAVSLYVGNFAFTYLNVAGCLRRGYYTTTKYALLSPVYWALMSVAAWKGFLQLFYAPSYWEKTTHGLYRGAPPGVTSDS